MIFHLHWWRDTQYYASLSYPVPIQICRCGMIRRYVTPEVAIVQKPSAELAAQLKQPKGKP